METLNDIELTEDEAIEATILAKQKKKKAIEEANRQATIEENRRKLTQTQWDFVQTKNFMLYRAQQLFEGKFLLDNNNSVVFDMLCYYFSNDEKFVTYAQEMNVFYPSLNKGLFLVGNFGVGKTWLMKLFAKNQRQVFFLRSAKELANFYEKEGEENFYQFLEPFKNPTNDSSLFYHKESGLCIDDLGTEDLKVHYGNRKNVIGDLLETRYSKGNMGLMLHATSNLTIDNLEQFYGGRVLSRLKEQVNLIELKGTDRRK